MKRCLIWGSGDFFRRYINVLRYWELRGEIEIIGITSKQQVFDEYLGYCYYDIESVIHLNFDYIIIAADSKASNSIEKDAISIGIKQNRILRINPFLLPDFSFDEYLKLLNHVPTIFADNCWGGITSSRLGFEFKSPLVNMYVKNNYYIKFLENPHKYIETPIEFKKMKYAPLVNKYYPLCVCDDIELRFNHYENFKEANDAWEKRKKRINWDNLFVVMITEDIEMATRFCMLPYEKKICFVPFETSAPELFYVDFYKYYNGPFWQAVVEMAQGKSYYYSLIDILNGKITKISKSR